MNGFPNELQDFCETVVTGKEPKSGSALGLDVVAACYAAYVSAKTGKRVDVPKVDSTAVKLGLVTYNLARTWDIDTIIARWRATGFGAV